MDNVLRGGREGGRRKRKERMCHKTTCFFQNGKGIHRRGDGKGGGKGRGEGGGRRQYCLLFFLQEWLSRKKKGEPSFAFIYLRKATMG